MTGKITEMNVAGALTGNELIELIQSGNNVQVQLANLVRIPLLLQLETENITAIAPDSSGITCRWTPTTHINTADVQWVADGYDNSLSHLDFFTTGFYELEIVSRIKTLDNNSNQVRFLTNNLTSNIRLNKRYLSDILPAVGGDNSIVRSKHYNLGESNSSNFDMWYAYQQEKFFINIHDVSKTNKMTFDNYIVLDVNGVGYTTDMLSYNIISSMVVNVKRIGPPVAPFIING